MKKIVIRKDQEPVVELNIMEDSELDFTIVDYTKKEDRYKEAQRLSSPKSAAGRGMRVPGGRQSGTRTRYNPPGSSTGKRRM